MYFSCGCQNHAEKRALRNMGKKSSSLNESRPSPRLFRVGAEGESQLTIAASETRIAR